jgi:carbonic anhydrase
MSHRHAQGARAAILTTATTTAVAAADSLQQLMDGKGRFARSRSEHPDQAPTRRATVAAQGVSASALAPLANGGSLPIVGVVYDFDSGAVAVVEPAQARP